MVSPRRLVGVTLASAAFIASGCGETIGTSAITPEGECIPAKTELKLGVDQSVYVGGDIKLGKEGIDDNLEIKNAGKGVIEVIRSAGDEGSIRFPNGAEIPAHADNDGESTELSFDVSAQSRSFSYSENDATIGINAAAQDLSTMAVELTTTCSSK